MIFSTLHGQGRIHLLDIMGDEDRIAMIARISYGREDSKDKEALIRRLIKNGHWSPFEQVMFTFRIRCPLFVRSQWMRHRTWSFNEISRRYTQPTEDDFYVRQELPELAKSFIRFHNKNAFGLYNELIAMGVAPEDARAVLPQNLMTDFYATIDLHNLIKFVNLRSTKHAQAEIREYAEAIKAMIGATFPSVAKGMRWIND